MIPTETTAMLRVGDILVVLCGPYRGKYIVLDADSDCTGTTARGVNETWANHDGSECDCYYDDFSIMCKEVDEARKAKIAFQKSFIENEKADSVFYPRPELKRRMMACNRFD